MQNLLSRTEVMYTLHFYAATHKDYLRDKLEASTCVSHRSYLRFYSI